jgi:predicted short-subunit dehydrogenase-like oxidoreductase (DUF2520 family)
VKLSKAKPIPTAIIGAGRLARALLPPLHSAGYAVVAVSSRTIASARRARRLAPGAAATTDNAAAAAEARLVLIAVPDGEIGAVAGELAEHSEQSWRGKVVLHHAGALGIKPLVPLRRKGAHVGVLHPLQCLGGTALSSELLAGSHARIEGDERARSAARRLARTLGLKVLPLPAKLSAEQRRLYHAAASLLSNDIVALLAIGSDLLRSIGLPESDALSALAVLARGTIAQAESRGFGAALTGPVVRGDAETVVMHLRALARRSRTGAAAHRALSRRLLQLAEERGAGTTRDRRRTLARALAAADS